MEPLVATVTFWRKALCLAASSGSRSRDDVRLGADEVDEDAVDALDSKLEMEEGRVIVVVLFRNKSDQCAW